MTRAVREHVGTDTGASLVREVRVEPGAQAWRGALSRENSGERARRFREQLGLPTGVPIAMSGHQAGVWHAGILAKRLAIGGAAEALGCADAWVVVDQDTNDAGAMAFPVRDGDGTLASREWRFDGRETPTGAPTALAQAVEPAPLPALASGERLATDSVGDSVERVRTALRRAIEEGGGAPSLAMQVARAAESLADAPGPACMLFGGTSLGATDLFAELYGRMCADPGACVRAFNDASAARPGAGVAALRDRHAQGGSGWELPVWELRRSASGAERRRVWSDALDEVRGTIVPRGLMMTGMLRLAGCELFVHGTGGAGEEGYDNVTGGWFDAWLGEALAPVALVTASAWMDFGEAPASGREARDAAWVAHHARHDPAMLGDSVGAARKRELIDRIDLSKALARGRHETEHAFREMHALLDEVRARHADRLAAFDAEAESARRRAASAVLLGSRGWAFPLLAEATLAGLIQRVRAALLAGGGA